MQERLVEAKQTAEQTVSEIEKLKDQLQQQSETITTADEKVKQLEASLADKKIIIEEKDKTIINITEEIISLREKIANAEAVQNENSTLSSQLEELRKEYNNYKKQTELEKQKKAEIAEAVANEKARGIEQAQIQMSSFINGLQLQTKKKSTKENSKSAEPEETTEIEITEGQLSFEDNDSTD